MSRIHNHKNKFALNDIKSPLLRAKGNLFVTQLSFGEVDDPYSPYLLLDIGSEMTWVQCEGCDPCFQINGKNFDYKKSSSFKRVSENDELCYPLEFTYEGSCGLTLDYGIIPPFPSVKGLMGRENFYFKNSRTSDREVYQGLVFGCGLVNENIHFGVNNGPENIIAGVYGLNGDPRSLFEETQFD
ncbi:putative aspartic protease At2g35615 [Silene latifolia]|uniref:putative aspartic protease At2g35615 n=1 Tax=Silene latifolia TaxID=37657 RepID=UPI003D76B076